MVLDKALWNLRQVFRVVHLFGHSVVSNSLWPHGLRHTRLPCPSLTPGDDSNSCPLSQWCHPNISSSVIPFFSCPQCFPPSGSFPMIRLFGSGGQSIGASASALASPVNIQDWFPLGLTGLISWQSKGLSRVFSYSKASIPGEGNGKNFSFLALKTPWTVWKDHQGSSLNIIISVLTALVAQVLIE